MNPGKFLQVSNSRYINFKNISEIEVLANSCNVSLIHGHIHCGSVPGERIVIDAESKFYETIKGVIVRKLLQVSNTRYINIKNISEIEIRDNTCIIRLIHAGSAGGA